MPLKRTPPASPSMSVVVPETVRNTNLKFNKALNDSPLKHSESEPDLHSQTLNVTERKKRKLEEEHTDIKALIKEMFSVFTKEQEKRFEELKSSMDVMSNKYDEFLANISILEKERQADKLIIKELEEKLETLERKCRGTSIEIRNMPKQNRETKETLCAELLQLGKTLNVNIDESNIRDIYRLKSKDDSNPVIVDLTTVPIKDKVIRAVKNFNKSKAKEDKLNTTHLNAKYQNKPLYIAETLTHRTQKLYFLARQFKKSHGFNFCWTANGFVYLKQNEGSPHIRVTHASDIDKLRNTI